ncbi:unnamed protein product [Acanthosepion pharaonis]|uniref:G-protein coupled receptors family 1 profile domain-containing protein n=1 Tax=Acanthosepion pharaonis TaxID=158019 RepID=A0A812DDI1_ACAPH|nr:unnamed protein product [Sepia pharaonis]
MKNIGLYLIALCVSDLFVLYVSLFNAFLSGAGIYGDNNNRFNCHIFRFFRAFFLDCSSWITVVITVQRTIAVYRPLSTYLRSSSNRTTPVKVLCILFVVMVIISAVYTNSFSFLPAIILIVCNVAIVFKIYHRPAVGQTPHPAHNNAQTVRLQYPPFSSFLFKFFSSFLHSFSHLKLISSTLTHLKLFVLSFPLHFKLSISSNFSILSHFLQTLSSQTLCSFFSSFFFLFNILSPF